MDLSMLWFITLIGLPISATSAYTVLGRIHSEKGFLLILFTWAGFPIAWIVGASTDRAQLAFLVYLAIVIVATFINRHAYNTH